jgi:hypothetical protein
VEEFRTPTWQSKRGKHRLFLRPDGLIPDKAKTMIDAIEVRGCSLTKGAQSEVPPSRGRWWLPGLSIYDVPVAPLPQPLVERLRVEAAKPQRKRRSPKKTHRLPSQRRLIYTFLQFVMEEVLGEPEEDLGNGEASWFCPQPACKDKKMPTLVSLPHKPQFPDKFRCRRCEWFGDEWDIIDLENSQEYGRSHRRIVLANEYHKLCPDGLHLEHELI